MILAGDWYGGGDLDRNNSILRDFLRCGRRVQCQSELGVWWGGSHALLGHANDDLCYCGVVDVLGCFWSSGAGESGAFVGWSGAGGEGDVPEEVHDGGCHLDGESIEDFAASPDDQEIEVF